MYGAVTNTKSSVVIVVYSVEDCETGEFKMSKPILYYHPMSPPSRAVLLVAKEIGLELDER